MAAPKPIGNILADLLARRGYARVQSGGDCAAAWREAAGELLSAHTRATQVKRGVLEVICVNSVLMQEMSFQKAGLLAKVAALLPDQKIKDLRFRIGPIDL